MIIVQTRDVVANFYDGIASAELDLEAVDVENGEYPAAYDAKGRIYDVRSQDERVLIEPRADDAADPDALAALLRTFLGFARIPTQGGESLAELLALCASRVESWERRGG